MPRLTSVLCAGAILTASGLIQSSDGNAAVELQASLALVMAKTASLEVACPDANSDYERSELGCPGDEEPDTHAPLSD